MSNKNPEMRFANPKTDLSINKRAYCIEGDTVNVICLCVWLYNGFRKTRLAYPDSVETLAVSTVWHKPGAVSVIPLLKQC